MAEEAYLALLAGKALYVSRIFGGASAEFIDVLEGQAGAECKSFEPREDVARSLNEWSPLDYSGASAREWVAGWSIEDISRKNGLSVEENRRLFHARQVNEDIGLIIKGLAKVEPGRANNRRR